MASSKHKEGATHYVFLTLLGGDKTFTYTGTDRPAIPSTSIYQIQCDNFDGKLSLVIELPPAPDDVDMWLSDGINTIRIVGNAYRCRHFHHRFLQNVRRLQKLADVEEIMQGQDEQPFRKASEPEYHHRKAILHVRFLLSAVVNARHAHICQRITTVPEQAPSAMKLQTGLKRGGGDHDGRNINSHTGRNLTPGILYTSTLVLAEIDHQNAIAKRWTGYRDFGLLICFADTRTHLAPESAGQERSLAWFYTVFHITSRI
ncbi:hypothetical protein F4777DRAFT_577707 [Nemania sp. FL0916]|nr:hypothetical protein F4777DRAFT_577707 [Nemania sp. FL0916]